LIVLIYGMKSNRLTINRPHGQSKLRIGHAAFSVALSLDRQKTESTS